MRDTIPSEVVDLDEFIASEEPAILIIYERPTPAEDLCKKLHAVLGDDLLQSLLRSERFASRVASAMDDGPFLARFGLAAPGPSKATLVVFKGGEVVAVSQAADAKIVAALQG